MSGLALALGFLGGVILHDSDVGLVLAVPVVFATLLSFVVIKPWPSRLLLICTIACVGVGAWRASYNGRSSHDVVVSLNGSDRWITAQVVGLPRATTSRTSATVRIPASSGGTVAVSLPVLPTIATGDVIRFWALTSWNTGVPNQVSLPAANGDPVFIPSFTVEGSDASRFDHIRSSVNSYATSAIDRHVPEPAGALALGILNGDDSRMTDATRAAFRSAGMSQITAVSGWNVAIVAGLIAILLRSVSPARTPSIAVGIMMVWGYAFLVGMEPSVVRAAGMASIFMLAHWRGRPGDLLTSLLLTTAVMVAMTPDIRFDIGFQLSVAATLGIVLLLELTYERPWWQTAIAVPVVAQIAVAPLLLHHLGTYSISSPVANMVTAPLVELVMGGGLATLVASAVHPALGDIAGAFTWVPARLIIAAAERTASFKALSGTSVTMGWTRTLCTYLALICGYLLWQRRVTLSRVTARSPRRDNSI